MNLILIILTGVLMGAFNFAFFAIGYYLGTKRTKQEGIEATKENAEFINEMMKWRMYGGE